MSRHGMYVVDKRRNTPDMKVAGVKKLPASGEENLQVIWPKDEGVWNAYNLAN